MLHDGVWRDTKVANRVELRPKHFGRLITEVKQEFLAKHQQRLLALGFKTFSLNQDIYSLTTGELDQPEEQPSEEAYAPGLSTKGALAVLESILSTIPLSHPNLRLVFQTRPKSETSFQGSVTKYEEIVVLLKHPDWPGKEIYSVLSMSIQESDWGRQSDPTFYLDQEKIKREVAAAL